MKIAIMQPYFFPYIGYFQLINAVDKFVLYDDVNFIKRGWINRNRILLNNKDYLITLPCKNLSQNLLINQIENNIDLKFKDKFLKTIEQAYKKAHYFKNVFPMIENLFNCDEQNLSVFLEHSIKNINDFLGIKTEILTSSKIKKNNELKGQDKIIEICKKLNANEYINAIGGTELYSKDLFLQNNIKLSFLKTNEITYKQINNDFISNLSIIDVLMFNSVMDINKMLTEFELI